ncbi:MAG: hypothetical protein AAB354_03885 [candidate division KSB1 bacterium]
MLQEYRKRESACRGERQKVKMEAHNSHLAVLCQPCFCKKSSYMIPNILLYCERNITPAKLPAGLSGARLFRFFCNAFVAKESKIFSHENGAAAKKSFSLS